jgi:hypothetical protein
MNTFIQIGEFLQNRDLQTVARNWRLVLSGPLKYLRSAFAGRLVRIPARLIVDEYAFSLAPEGWHYFRALVAEYEKDPNVLLENTTFFNFFQQERVKSIRTLNDLLFLHDPEKRARREGFQFYFGTYPWGDWGKKESLVGGKPFGYYYDRIEGKMTRDMYGFRTNPWYQPEDPVPLWFEWEKTIRLYRSLRRGYFPVIYNSFPTVILLERRNGEMRAVRREGNHRLSILSHLGYEQLTVEISPESIEIVREADLANWYYVKNGICSPEQARCIFDAYFELNGRERIEFLGLPPVY